MMLKLGFGVAVSVGLVGDAVSSLPRPVLLASFSGSWVAGGDDIGRLRGSQDVLHIIATYYAPHRLHEENQLLGKGGERPTNGENEGRGITRATATISMEMTAEVRNVGNGWRELSAAAVGTHSTESHISDRPTDSLTLSAKTNTRLAFSKYGRVPTTTAADK